MLNDTCLIAPKLYLDICSLINSEVKLGLSTRRKDCALFSGPRIFTLLCMLDFIGVHLLLLIFSVISYLIVRVSFTAVAAPTQTTTQTFRMLPFAPAPLPGRWSLTLLPPLLELGKHDTLQHLTKQGGICHRRQRQMLLTGPNRHVWLIDRHHQHMGRRPRPFLADRDLCLWRELGRILYACEGSQYPGVVENHDPDWKYREIPIFRPSSVD